VREIPRVQSSRRYYYCTQNVLRRGCQVDCMWDMIFNPSYRCEGPVDVHSYESSEIMSLTSHLQYILIRLIPQALRSDGSSSSVPQFISNGPIASESGRGIAAFLVDPCRKHEIDRRCHFLSFSPSRPPASRIMYPGSCGSGDRQQPRVRSNL